jgi:hypothetical protein
MSWDYAMSIDASDDLRTLGNLTSPDARQGASDLTPPMLRRTIEGHHADLASLRLHETAPEDLQIHFLTAVNLLLYSWFVYRFVHAAELHALGALEWALRDRLGRKGMLNKLLKVAVHERLVTDSPLRAYQRQRKAERDAWEEEQRWPDEFRNLFGTRAEPKPAEDDRAWVRVLARKLPVLRNELAHGSPLLYSEGVLRVELCCDLINQLYDSDVQRAEYT